MNPVLISTLLVVGALSACTTTREAIEAVPDSPDIEQARAEQIVDAEVRWGGAVVKVENFSDHTLVEVISRILDRSSAPHKSDDSNGRFIARIDHFIDPENLKPGRRITVRGKITEWQVNKIGEYDYRYPLVAVKNYKIWPKAQPRPSRYYDPYWDYPFWGDPFWGRPYSRGWPYRDRFGLHYQHWYY